MEEITGANAVTTMTTGGLKNARWLPPELLQPRMDDVPATSFDTDVWSFSMAVIECMTGQRPYADVKKVLAFCGARRLNKPVNLVLAPGSSILVSHLQP